MAFTGYSLSALAAQVRANMASIAAAITRITSLESGKVNKTQKVNGHALTGDVTVTKADVGLSQVSNYPSINSVTDPSTVKYAVAASVKTAYDRGTAGVNAASTAQSGLNSHVGNKANPHAVTKAQVGLSNVPNYSITSSVADSSDSKFSTAGAVKKAYDLAASKITKAQGDSYYAPKSHTHDTLTTKTISDWNATNISNGFIQGENKPNNPVGGWVWGINMQHSGGYGMQVVTGNGGNNFYIRSRTSNGSGSWGKIYTNISKPSPSEIGAVAKAVLDSMFPVGHILLTTNSANPSTYGYVGTWALVENDASLHTTTGSGVGTYTGSNTPAVPVPLHSHSASSGSVTLDKRFNTNATGNHAHDRGNMNITGDFRPVMRGTGSGWCPIDDYSGAMTPMNDFNTGVNAISADGRVTMRSGVRFNAANSWTGNTNTTGNHTHYTDVNFGGHSHSVSVANAGTSGATLDVRGRRFMVYAWRRTK